MTCLSCHFDDGEMVGPVASSALVDPHPVAVARGIYRSSELCGKCHEGTYREWLAAPAEDRRTCQDCHMGRVTRTATQATSAISKVLVSFEEEFEGRRHTFHVPLDGTIDDALAVEVHGVRRDEETLRCELQGAGAGADAERFAGLPAVAPAPDVVGPRARDDGQALRPAGDDPRPDAGDAVTGPEPERTVRRFTPSEIVFHWAQAIPYLVLLVTGAVLFAERILDLDAVSKSTLIDVHRIAGVALPVCILLAFLGGE